MHELIKKNVSTFLGSMYFWEYNYVKPFFRLQTFHSTFKILFGGGGDCLRCNLEVFVLQTISTGPIVQPFFTSHEKIKARPQAPALTGWLKPCLLSFK